MKAVYTRREFLFAAYLSVLFGVIFHFFVNFVVRVVNFIVVNIWAKGFLAFVFFFLTYKFFAGPFIKIVDMAVEK